MDTRELRLGNYVRSNFYKAGLETRISSILSSDKVRLETVPLAIYNLKDKDISSIDLTDELFLKFGFKPAGIHDFLYKNIFIVNYAGLYYRAYLDGKTRIDLALKYIHQLQNLFHSLTGEELTMKE